MMAIVERSKYEFPQFVWARDIHIAHHDNFFEIVGVVPVLYPERYADTDALHAYRRAMIRYGGTKRQGKNSPAIQFANADTIEKRRSFVSSYGPVVVYSARTEERAVTISVPVEIQTTETLLVAHQDLVELEKEHLIYRSALTLLSELQKGKDADVASVRGCILSIVDNVVEWPKQWERERQIRVSGIGYSQEPHWKFTQKDFDRIERSFFEAKREKSGDPLRDALLFLGPVFCGHHVICGLLNAFPPVVYPWGKSPVEMPSWDIATGIRPLLYYMLRREYLNAGGIRICRNVECRDIFEIERSGQEFCGEQCSRLQRQREYWSNRGKKLRKVRLARRARSSNNLKGRKETLR